MSIKDNIQYIEGLKKEAAEKVGKSADEVLLIAVTKLHSPEEINQAIDAGIGDIGENKVQEILDKYEKVKPVRWHLIGHLQTNKVKYIIDKVDLIHSVDSYKLAQEIEKRAAQHEKNMDILVQVSPVNEETKFGVSMEEVKSLVSEISENCPHITIKGLMCIAPFYENPEDVRQIFADVKSVYDGLKEMQHERIDFKYLSMGMSHDFQVAIEEGANCIRVGTAIFGNRDYRSEEK